MFFTDQLNRTIELQKFPKRIISLVPSQTELLYQLGLDDNVIGVTKFCIHPSHWKKKKKIVGGTKNYKIELIDNLKPDLIIANKEENNKDSLENLMQKHNVWISDIKTLDHATQMIDLIGKMTDTSQISKKLNQKINVQFQILKTLQKKKKKVVYLIWNKPLMTINNDTFINHLMSLNNWENCYGNHNSRYPELTEEELVEMNPDILFLSSEPFPFKIKHIEQFKQLLPTTKILIVDGEYFSWYGSRLVDSPAYFSSIHRQLISN